MQQSGFKSNEASAISPFFEAENAVPSHQETLGQIVMEVLRSGRQLNRQSVCSKILSRLEQSDSPGMESHYKELIGFLLGRGN